MTNEILRMQMLAGVITEGQYKAKLQESLWDRIKDTPKAWIAKIKGGASATMASAFSDGGIIIGKPVYFYDGSELYKLTIKSINYNTGISDLIYEKSLDGGKNWKTDEKESLSRKLGFDEELSRILTQPPEEQKVWYDKTVESIKKQFLEDDLSYNIEDLKTEGQYKAKLMEFDMNQFSMGNSSSPKASFEDKWNDVPNANKEILKKSTGKEPVKIMASSKGENYVITKGSDGKFYRYQYTKAENPGKPMGPFNSENEAKKLNESLKESMIGGIVGIGAINQIPPRAKTDYEMAFEHFLGERYEKHFENREQNPYTMEEAEIPAIDPKIANDKARLRAFQDLASYFERNPNKAKDVKDELSSLKEAYKKDGLYYDEDEYGDKKEVPFKEYLIAKLVKIGLPAAALGFVGALMAGPLGVMAPGEILQAIGIAAGIGGAAGAALDYGETKPIGEDKEFKEGEINENIGDDLTNFINSFPFSQEGNDELIDFANKLLDGKLSPEEFTKLKSFVDELEFFKLVSDPNRGIKSIAQQIFQRLKQGTASGGGIETFSSNPKALQALKGKLS